MWDEGWLAVMKGLEEGGCPGLQDLDMSECNVSVAVAVALTRALSSGHCHHLEELYFYDACGDDESMEFVLRSIKNLHFPFMREFDLSDIGSYQVHSMLLGEALKAGAFPKLRAVRFCEQSIHHSLWEALEAGSCQEMRELELKGVLLDSDSSLALASALASGWLNKLQRFHFCGTIDDDDDDSSLEEVLVALASSCPDLCHLNVSGGCRNPTTR